MNFRFQLLPHNLLGTIQKPIQMLSNKMQLSKPCMYTTDGSFMVPIKSPYIWMSMGDDPKLLHLCHM